MKLSNIFKLSFLAILISFSFSSCLKDKEIIQDKTPELKLVTTLKGDNHDVEIYTHNGKLKKGYNEIFFQVKNEFGAYLRHNPIKWTPVMKMTNMSHSTPASNLTAMPGSPLTSMGYIIFNMASNEQDYWTLKVDYTVDGQINQVEGTIEVEDVTDSRIVQSINATDSNRYVLAMIEPAKPKEGKNEMIAALYQMEDMMNFVPVEGFKILIDPRMPNMGNHDSPNNIDLTSSGSGIYHGAVNFTMTGYWKINLQLENKDAEIISGNPVTEEQESSEIFFDLKL